MARKGDGTAGGQQCHAEHILYGLPTSYPVLITDIVPASRKDSKTVHFLKKCFTFQKGVSVMTTSYYAERANLYRLEQVHPQWSHQQLAATLGRSREWVKKWRKRFREEVAADIPLERVLQGHSRSRKHPRCPARGLATGSWPRSHCLLSRAGGRAGT
jgi:Homeodomain-like domain